MHRCIIFLLQTECVKYWCGQVSPVTNQTSVSSVTVASSCRAHAGVAARSPLALARRLRRDSPVAAPGSSPPAGIPSASFAPRCSRDAPPPTHGSQHRQDNKKKRKKKKKRARWYADEPLDGLAGNKKKKKKKKSSGDDTSQSLYPKKLKDGCLSFFFFVFFYL